MQAKAYLCSCHHSVLVSLISCLESLLLSFFQGGKGKNMNILGDEDDGETDVVSSEEEDE